MWFIFPIQYFFNPLEGEGVPPTRGKFLHVSLSCGLPPEQSRTCHCVCGDKSPGAALLGWEEGSDEVLHLAKGQAVLAFTPVLALYRSEMEADMVWGPSGTAMGTMKQRMERTTSSSAPGWAGSATAPETISMRSGV